MPDLTRIIDALVALIIDALVALHSSIIATLTGLERVSAMEVS